MLKEYTKLIKVTLLVLISVLLFGGGYKYASLKYELKESEQLAQVRKDLADLQAKYKLKEDAVKNDHKDIDNTDSAEVLALQNTIVANESVNSQLRAEIAKYKSMSKSTGSTGVNREFAAVATDAIVYADLFGRANDTATELAYIATEAYRRGRNCEMKYDAVYQQYQF